MNGVGEENEWASTVKKSCNMVNGWRGIRDMSCWMCRVFGTAQERRTTSRMYMQDTFPDFIV